MGPFHRLPHCLLAPGLLADTDFLSEQKSAAVDLLPGSLPHPLDCSSVPKMLPPLAWKGRSLIWTKPWYLSMLPSHPMDSRVKQ